MKKIISLFQRNYNGDRLVRDEVVPGAEWVLALTEDQRKLAAIREVADELERLAKECDPFTNLGGFLAGRQSSLRYARKSVLAILDCAAGSEQGSSE